MEEKVSVIIPVYNGEKYIKRCVESVINQSYKSIEIMVINDGSQDGTIDIITELSTQDNRVKIINKENSGVGDSRNLGIDQSEGEYLTFVDADDWLDENYIATLVENIQKFDCDVVVSNSTNHYEEGISTVKFIDIDQSKILEGGKAIYSECIKRPNWIFVVWGKLYKRNSKFSARFCKQPFGEDGLFMLEYLNNTPKMCLIKEAGYNYYVNFDSVTHDYSRDFLLDMYLLEVSFTYWSRGKEYKAEGNYSALEWYIIWRWLSVFVGSLNNSNKLKVLNNIIFRRYVNNEKSLKILESIYPALKKFEKRELKNIIGLKICDYLYMGIKEN